MTGKGRRRRRTANEETAPTPRPAAAADEPAASYTTTDPVQEDLARTLPLHHPLWIHPEVQATLRAAEPLYRRLGLVIEQLGARGRTSTVKTCQGDNRGWYRTPLGGGGGSHFYLWWTTAGTRQGKEIGLPEGAIAIRAARHHDNHHPLDGVERKDYRPIPHASAIDESVAGNPWTKAQVQFRNAQEPVRVLEGHPGSGKTTALWHSVDARNDDHVLYITWSRALAEDANNHFTSFAAAPVKTTCTDYASLLAILTDEPAARMSLRESYQALSESLEEIEGASANTWLHFPYGLHAELRGILLGGATEIGGTSTTVQDGCLRLSDEAYRKHRRRIRGIEERNIQGLLDAARKLPPETLGKVFPELVAARKALERLRDHPAPPEELTDVDRIVVDEAQDLTLTETSVITGLCQQIGEASGRRPKLLMAGDEGQTVRPSSFSWRRTRELVNNSIGRPRTYVLDGQVRCPSRISSAAGITKEYYHNLEKGTRPGGQHQHPGAPPLGGGRLLRVSTTGSEREVLLRKLVENTSICVITATAAVPDWVPEDLKEQVLTPAEAKGLEYQTVCIVNLFAGCGTAATATGLGSGDPTLSQELRRAAIDQVRVAMTRATDTLVILEEQDKYHIPALDRLSDQCAAADLLADLTDDAPALERALTLSEECRHLRDENVSRALLRGRQAVELILAENSTRTPDQADEALQQQVTDAVLRTVAAHLLLENRTEEQKKFAMGTGIAAIEIRHSLTQLDGTPPDAGLQATIEEELLVSMFDWREGHAGAALTTADRFMLLHERKDKYSGWADSALRGARHELADALEKGAGTPQGWRCLRPNVLAWLEALEIDDKEARAKRIAERAFYNLLADGADRNGSNDAATLLNRAEAILATLDDDPARTALVEELESRPIEALRLYQRAGADAEAKRVIAENALWEDAEQLDGEARDNARWLMEFENLVGKMPIELPQRLSPVDRERLTTRAGGEIERLLRARRSQPQGARRGRPKETR